MKLTLSHLAAAWTFVHSSISIAALESSEKPLASPTLVTLGAIDDEVTPDHAVITIRLDQKPDWTQLKPAQDHGSFLQLILPNTIVPDPGTFYETKNPEVTKIGVFQISPSDAAIRLFLPKASGNLNGRLRSELLGSRIILTIGKSTLESSSNLVGPPEPSNHEKDLSAEDVIAKTNVQRDIPKPSETFASRNTSMTSPLRSNLTRLASGGAFLFALMLASMMLKQFLRKKSLTLSKGEQPITLKTLASLPLATKQQVTVIQVGNEKILLGITPDQISFLTILNKNHMDTALPDDMTRSPKSIAQQVSKKRLLPSDKVREPAILTEGPTRFDEALSDEPTMTLKEKPRLKNIPGNDEETLRGARKSTGSDLRMSGADRSRGQRINIGVDDQGIRPMGRSRPSSIEPSQEAIEDVTRMIREKLKTLKSI